MSAGDTKHCVQKHSVGSQQSSEWFTALYYSVLFVCICIMFMYDMYDAGMGMMVYVHDISMIKQNWML